MTAKQEPNATLRKRVTDLELGQGKLKRELAAMRKEAGDKSNDELAEWIGKTIRIRTLSGEIVNGTLARVNKFSLSMSSMAGKWLVQKSSIETVSLIEG